MKTKNLAEKLVEIRRQEEETKTKHLAAKLNLSYLNLVALPIDPEGLALLPEKISRQANLMILQKHGNNLQIALTDPDSSASQKVLEDLTAQGFVYSLFLVSQSGLDKAMEHYQKIALVKKQIIEKIEISPQVIQQFHQEIKNIEDLKTKINQIPANDFSRLLEIIIAGGLGLDASDVHLEPKEKNICLRYRLDGLLHQAVFLSPAAYNILLPKIKLLAGLKLNIHDMAQDGRFTIKLSERSLRKETDIEVRVSAIPSAYGENIVLRILNPKTIGLNLEELGFQKEELKIIEEQLKKPNGLIVVTGPTGSGKTTTLYAFLKKVAKPEIKVITLEDPIEYHLEGITQTQVETESGYTFAAGLRAILRQDPDVILVGEIRDKETAEIAVNASLTGHLVFSTLHTNDAAGAIPRFIDLGAKPGTLAAGLSLIIAQRLVRKLCHQCKKEYKPTDEIINKIKKALPASQGEAWRAGLPDFKDKMIFYQTRGCAQCNGTGYKGRIVISEMLVVDQNLEKLISASPTHSQMLDFARKKEMMNMRLDGLLKALSGQTTIEEIERVAGAE